MHNLDVVWPGRNQTSINARCFIIFLRKYAWGSCWIGSQLPCPDHFKINLKFFLSMLSFIYLFIFRERGKEWERGGEKHQCVIASCTPPTGHLACNPGMCSDWEWNRQPFVLQAGTQSTEPHQPGLKWTVLFILFYFLQFLLLFSYSCLHFLPIPPPHPSQSHLSPPPLPSPLILSMCPLQ